MRRYERPSSGGFGEVEPVSVHLDQPRNELLQGTIEVAALGVFLRVVGPAIETALARHRVEGEIVGLFFFFELDRLFVGELTPRRLPGRRRRLLALLVAADYVSEALQLAKLSSRAVVLEHRRRFGHRRPRDRTGSVERATAQRGVEQESTAIGVRGLERETIPHVAKDSVLRIVDLLREKDALDEVQSTVGPRVEIPREILVEEIAIEEALLELRREERSHHTVEVLRIAPLQEQMQLVTRVLRVQLGTTLLTEIRPFHQEAEAEPARVVRQRSEQPEHALE